MEKNEPNQIVWYKIWNDLLDILEGVLQNRFISQSLHFSLFERFPPIFRLDFHDGHSFNLDTPSTFHFHQVRHDWESIRRPPDYGRDAVSTRPCFHDKNLSQPTSLSLCLHIAPSLLKLCQSGFSRYRAQCCYLPSAVDVWHTVLILAGPDPQWFPLLFPACPRQEVLLLLSGPFIPFL